MSRNVLDTPTPAAEPTAVAGGGAATLVSADAWFSAGARRPYDPVTKSILADGTHSALQVFERVVTGAGKISISTRWATFLPGFPDGSYGFSRVDDLLGEEVTPRLFVEYLGQGDSDKPAHHRYSTTERADLVEAQWANHRIERTTIVTFDYSSLVLMELLARHQERIAAGQPTTPGIDAVLIVNGGLFADAHSHPWHATPLIKSVLGGPLMWAAQRSERIFGQIIGSANMFSKEYRVSRDEIHELYSAITRRAGAAFLHRAAGFVAEHKANADRWDLRRLYLLRRDSTVFVVAGSEADPYEHKQIDGARQRLGSQGLRVRMFPGGHMTTSEHPDLLADEIVAVFRATS